MALVRWEPLREMATLQNEMNRLFGTFFDTPTTAMSNGNGFRRWIPAMDLVETEEHFVLRADLPGLGEDDVKIEAVDNVLTIAGERKARAPFGGAEGSDEAKGEGYYRLERGSGAFSRTLNLPEGVDASQITARFDKGVLEVRIPKPEERKPHRVEIQVGDQPAAIEG